MQNSPWGREPVEVRIAGLFRKKRKTLAVAESCTGGLVSSRVTDVPGSSDYFVGGVVAYSNDVKTSVLSVPPEVLEKYGAVSRQAARSMAEGVRGVLNADIAVAVTGIAGPGGGTAEKPVGLAYIAFASDKAARTRKLIFKGDRASLKEQFSKAALELVLECC